MSDFDKEAEREKLREKYERDKAERKATQRMSDLLLKGATMTNMHCGTCGDPLFTQDGTTFCPSCHGNPDAVEGTDLEAQPAEQSSDAAADESAAGDAADASAQSIDVESPSQTESATDATDAAGTDETSERPDPNESAGQKRSASASSERSRESDSSRHVQQADDAETPSQPQSQSPGRAADRDDPQPTAGEHRTGGHHDRTTHRAAASPPVDGDLESARESLVQALEKFAGEAAATDDPRYATECLEAAREAGEALSTLR